MNNPVVFAAAGMALVIDLKEQTLPVVRHWGADIGPVTDDDAQNLIRAGTPGHEQATVDAPVHLPLLPAQSDGWLGRPGISGHRSGQYPHLRLVPTVAAEVTMDPAGGGRLVASAADTEAGVAVRVELELTPQGVLKVRQAVTNTGADTYTLDGVLCQLPLPEQSIELLHMDGRWCRERAPERLPFPHGTFARESRRGRTGHDATLLLIAGTPGFSFRAGEVWGVHAGWSGNHVHLAQRFPEYEPTLGAGELLLPGEVRLLPGDSYETPTVYFTYSANGLDGLSESLHSYVRARPSHPVTQRPVVLNTWEAVYFDHRLDRLTALAKVAADVGVERFVLDDGWFMHRRDDHAGLGDWYVDPAVWPDGLHPLTDRVRGLGMRFGLWVEPEMINPDSDLARAHPEWMLVAPGRPALPARRQQVLDVARPEVYAYLLERLDSLVTEYAIEYLKWDHNRDLLEAVHDGAAGVHAQTKAVYRLLDELRARHPGLEIESCSSGGARVDLGILERTDRVWGSDTNDPLERQSIQRWTGLLIPPELVGGHVGPPDTHTTGRTTRLSFRYVTALFGHAGIEWDITGCNADELTELSRWIEAYKRLRPLLHSGRTVRADHPDPHTWLHGVVAQDGSAAVFACAQLTTSPAVIPARLRFPGLDPDARYEVRLCPDLDPPLWTSLALPPWLTGDPVTLTGRALATYGLTSPGLLPEDAFVLELTRV
jgi:alpha-galactosidase